MSYNEFLKGKDTGLIASGFKPDKLNNNLFHFQKAIVNWSLNRGKSALFAGTGLGKSLMELSWANALYEHEKEKTIIFTPLAVASQMVREAKKFGIDAVQVSNSNESNCPIQVTNYQKLEHFDMSKYNGVILDESSILKNQSGKFRTKLIDVCKHIPYRLPATATPSPNDYMELGNHAEFTGIMSYTDMLSTFFVHDAAKTQDWRLKGHAEDKFWEWMASWSIMLQNPRDLGFCGDDYDLPKLHKIQHTVDVEYTGNIDTGTLFPVEARGLGERLKARRATYLERCKKAAQVVSEKPSDYWVVWCNLNDESDLLAKLIPNSKQVTGSMKDTDKEKTLESFQNGEFKVLISKPSICGFGLNFQHCSNTAFVGLNDSFEQVYQAIRRFWRFGQKNEVYAHFIASEIEGAVVQNLKRKELQAEHMMSMMVNHMADLNASNIRGAIRDTTNYKPQEKMELPTWMK